MLCRPASSGVEERKRKERKTYFILSALDCSIVCDGLQFGASQAPRVMVSRVFVGLVFKNHMIHFILKLKYLREGGYSSFRSWLFCLRGVQASS